MNNGLTQTLKQGDTSGIWLVGHKNIDGNWLSLVTGYTCTVKIKGTTVPSRIVTDKNSAQDRFIVALLPSETVALVVGQTYEVAIQLDNATYIPQLSKEVCRRVFIDDAGI